MDIIAQFDGLSPEMSHVQLQTSAAAISKLGQFGLPHYIVCLLEDIPKRHWSLLSGVYAMWSKKSAHTQCKGVYRIELSTFFLYLSKITSNSPEIYSSKNKITSRKKLLK